MLCEDNIMQYLIFLPVFLLRFASNVPKLLDLCCGRGGDMHKWLNFRVGLSFCPFVLLGPS